MYKMPKYNGQFSWLPTSISALQDSVPFIFDRVVVCDLSDVFEFIVI